MNTALLTPYYGDDMPIVFFDEVADEAFAAVAKLHPDKVN